jgi:hypothetical protein
MVEFECERCRAWVCSFAYDQTPKHGALCFRCAFLIETVPDPVERAEIERHIERAERKEP